MLEIDIIYLGLKSEGRSDKINDKLNFKHSTTSNLVGDDSTKPFDLKNTNQRNLGNMMDFINQSVTKEQLDGKRGSKTKTKGHKNLSNTETRSKLFIN